MKMDTDCGRCKQTLHALKIIEVRTIKNNTRMLFLSLAS